MKLTKKRLQELNDELIGIKEDNANHNRLIEGKLSNLAKDIFDIIDPPKKGYVRFQTRTGYVQFKKRPDRLASKKLLKQVFG